MKSAPFSIVTLAACCIGLLPVVAAPVSDSEDKADSDRELRSLYQDAGWVLTGAFVKREEAGKPSNTQTIYTFSDCKHFKEKRGFGPIKVGSTSSIGVYGVDDRLEAAKTGKRYILFVSVDYGKVLSSTPETKEQIKLIDQWAKNGVYTKAERDELYGKADWIVTVSRPKEYCQESYPCGHHWSFPVSQVFKGKDTPENIDLKGSYKQHSDMPDPLKMTSSTGKLVLFLKRNAKLDKDVLGAIPWSTALEKELTRNQ